MAAAILGDTCGYMLGRQTGPRIFRRPDSKLFRREHLSYFHADWMGLNAITDRMGRPEDLLWFSVPVIVSPDLATNAVEARPFRRAAFRLLTSVVEVTTSGAVPMAAAEIS